MTKLVVNPAHPTVRRDLQDIHRMHQILTKLFCPPDFGPNSRRAAGLLYRIEHTNAGVSILAQSRTTIDVQRLPSGYAYGGTRDLDPLFDLLQPGVQLRYRIVANPTKQLNVPGKRGTLRPVRGDSVFGWWERKAADAGLSVKVTDITQTKVMRGIRVKNGRDDRVVLTTATIEGIATIDKPHQLHESLLAGIGRGRAYGCGLLSVALAD